MVYGLHYPCYDSHMSRSFLDAIEESIGSEKQVFITDGERGVKIALIDSDDIVSKHLKLRFGGNHNRAFFSSDNVNPSFGGYR